MVRFFFPASLLALLGYAAAVCRVVTESALGAITLTAFCANRPYGGRERIVNIYQLSVPLADLAAGRSISQHPPSTDC
jgi:hypothetical protein